MPIGHWLNQPESIIGMSLNNAFAKKIKKSQKGVDKPCPRLVYSRHNQGTDAKPDGRRKVTVAGYVLT